MATIRSTEDRQSGRRFWLSLVIIIASLTLLLFASSLVFFKDLKAETAFTAIIGLVGTWVGTILAFYFSKDNFEAASESTRKLVDKVTSVEEKLKSTPSKEEMLPLDKIKYLKLDEGKSLDNVDYKLDKLIIDYLEDHNRLPVFNHDLSPKFIIHRSIFDKVISEAARKAKETPPTTTGEETNTGSGEETNTGTVKETSPKSVVDLTLKDMENDEKIKEQIESYVTVSEDDTLADVKSLMENNGKSGVLCSDAFVTKNNKVIGWITNVDLARHSEVKN